MLLQVLDGQGDPQLIPVQGVATPTKRSYAILATGDNELLLAANPARSGWLAQVVSAQGGAVGVDDTGTDATAPGALSLGQGQIFGTHTGYPVTQGAIYVSGTAGDVVVTREW